MYKLNVHIFPVSDNYRVNCNNGNFFRNKLLVHIPEILYFDDYIHDYIQNFATLPLNLFKRSGVIRVSAKTESSYNEFKKISSRSYINREKRNNLRPPKQNIM